MVEFSAKIKKGEHAGTKFIGEVLDLRHRLPQLWGKVMRCEVEGWQARGIARATHHLALEQALEVDDDLARHAGVVGWGKLQNLTEAAIIRVDGERIERETAERKSELGVWLSQTNDAGLKGFFGQLEPPDAIRLYAKVQEIADCLPPESGTADERRAAALAMLGDEGQIARLRAKHRQPDLFDEQFAAAVQAITGEEDPDDPLEESEIHPFLRENPTTAVDVESAIFKAAVERIVQNLDPALLMPTSTLVVHIAAESLAGGHGVCRVPGIGPATMGTVRDWLGHHRVKVLPVIDLNDPPPPVDCYEIPDRQRRHVLLRQPASAFPWSTATLGLDLDHSDPYRPIDRGGPPGQTAVDALAPFARREHRAITFGGWQRRQPDPGTMIFRAPHGTIYVTNHTGTHDLGDGPFARAIWTTSDPSRS
jgi:hypothetical protein